MGMMMQTPSDVVAFLKAQHQEIKVMFERVLATRGVDRAKAFYALRRTLAVHETAEEEIVHPAARHALPDGEVVVEARLREEHDAKTALSVLEELPVESTEFESQLRLLKTQVVAHAEAEERDEFERLASKLDTGRLERMRKAAAFAESIAPTRPHAGLESPAANMLAGPFVAMVDRVRDALSGKS